MDVGCQLFKMATSLFLRLRRLSPEPLLNRPQLTCHPLSAKVDEKVNINIQGLEPHQKISLYAKLRGEGGDRYHSMALYIADNQGRVSLHSQPSVGGSFTGIEPMGFIWSLKAEPNQRPGRRFMRRDVTKPYLVNLAVLDGHIDILKTENCHPLSRLTIERHYMAAGVRRVSVHEGRIRGTLFLPPGEGPFQGVIDLIGGHGGLVEFKAALLASNGFASLALTYFGYEDLPETLVNLELEYFIEAVDWLKGHPSIIPGGVGVMGISKGAEIALLLTANCQDVKASIVVSGFYCLSMVPMLHRNKTIPFYPYSFMKNNEIEYSGIEPLKCIDYCCNDNWSGSIQDHPIAIPIENASASILLIYGTDDHTYNTEMSASNIYDRLKAFGKEAQCFMLGYHGAGHLIEPPYSPHSSISFQKSVNTYISWGGETKAHALAQENSWPKILSFLQEHLPKKNISKL